MPTPAPESSGRKSSATRQPVSEPVVAPAAEEENAPTVISSTRPRIDAWTVESLCGQTLGHFQLQDAIGRGGMAAVIRAQDLQLGRTVALKILPPEMATDPENIARFKSEGRAAAQLDHENIARVYFCGEDQGLHFIAFEFVEGTDLRTMLAQQGPLSPSQAARFLLQVATGLAHAAERGVVHRDIKPSNIIVTPEGRAKIVDMGLARQTNVVGGVTQSGTTLGTFDYISPEQALEPRSADVRSDIYSLGCTFYHLLTGVPPVPEGTAAKKLHHHQQVAPVDPRDLNPGIPDDLAAILSRMMAKDPRDRYQRPEHLVQHLIVLAQKLNAAGEGSAQETVLFMDAPLPQPPRFSPWLTGVLAAAAVAVLVAMLGVIGGRDAGTLRPPFWKNSEEGGPSPPVVANAPPAAGPEVRPDPAPAPVEARSAATIQELVRLLDQKVEHIRLTGAVYDFGELAHANAMSPASGYRITGRRLRIEGAANGPLPVIRWSRSPGSRDVEPTGAFTIAPADPDAQMDFAHIRFEVQSGDDDAPLYAVVARAVGRLSFRRCEFVHERQSEQPVGGLILFEERGDKPALLTVDECLLVRGPTAIDLSDRAQLKATHCAFGPHDVLVRVRPAAVRTTPNAAWDIAELRYCTAMIRSGAVFHVERGASGTLRAGWSVFARTGEPGDAGEAALVRQKDGGDAIVYAGPDGDTPARNAYFQLVLWDAGGRKATHVVEARKLFRFEDAAAVELGQRPWTTPQPLQMLDDRPKEAFALATTTAALRTQPRSDRMLGVQRCTWGDTYKFVALKPLPEEPTEGQITRRVVNPSWPAEMPLSPATYRTLESAISEAKPGDMIVIQSNGVVELQPIRWSRNDDRPLVIRGDDGYRPVLALHSEAAEPTAALFTVAAGRVEFRDLHFRLRAEAKQEIDSLAAVTLVSAGQAGFQRCTITLDDNEGCRYAAVQVTGDADPASRAADRRPRVRFDQCFVRGKGNLLEVRPSRRFEVEGENTLIALEGSFASIHGNAKEAPTLPGSITLVRVTAYLHDYWLDLRLTDEERKGGGGMAATHCKLERCLLVAGNGKALVHAFGIDSDSLQKQYLSWESRGNIYANFVQMVEVELASASMMMPTMPISPKAWRIFTREGEDSFTDVKIAKAPTSERTLADMQPDDFRVKPLDMKKVDTPGDTGANLAEIPLPVEEKQE